MKLSVLSVLALCIGVASCQSSEKNPSEVRAEMLAMKPAIDSVPQSGLGPQDLAIGDCGLFLWSQTDVSKFIFFSRALSGTATFAQGELPIVLTQTTAGGDIFGQFNTNADYVAEDGRSLKLAVVPGEILDGGQRIERGLLTMTDRDGWETKLPVLGVRACKQE